MNTGLLPITGIISLEGANSLFLTFLKIMFLAGFLIYSVFAFMIIRQTTLMENTYKTTLGPLLKLFSIAHFLVAVGVLVLAFFSL